MTRNGATAPKSVFIVAQAAKPLASMRLSRCATVTAFFNSVEKWRSNTYSPKQTIYVDSRFYDHVLKVLHLRT